MKRSICFIALALSACNSSTAPNSAATHTPVIPAAPDMPAVVPTHTPAVMPFDWITSSKNKVLNGAMIFDQNKEGGVYTSLATAEVYSLDQWRYMGGGLSHSYQSPLCSQSARH